MEHLLNAEAVAELLAVSRVRVYELVRLNIIPKSVTVQIGRNLRFKQSALQAWIENGGSGLDEK